jgi:hypothetical protein
MGYAGDIIPIEVGEGGLLTDLSPSKIPLNNLIRATNVQVNKGVLEKAFGAINFNNTPLDSGVVAAYDYWPVPGKQYTIAVTRSGRVYRIADKFTTVEIRPTTDQDLIDESGEAPDHLNVTERVIIVEGGKEFLGDGGEVQPAKIFIFSGNDPIQVIYGEEVERHNLLVPAADWNGDEGRTAYPKFGVIYVGRLFVFDCDTFPHQGYASSNTVSLTMKGHEDFSEATFNTALFNIYPGDGERVKMAFKYKTKLWVLKYPRGLYSLEIPDIGDVTTWWFQKVNDDVGTPSPTGADTIIDDVWVSNSVGSVQSLIATLNLGGVSSTNVLRNLQIEKYVQSITSPLGYGERQIFFHQARSQLYIIYRKINAQHNSLILFMDLTQQNPKPTVFDHHQPNVMAIRRNESQVEEVMYGSEDGYIYLMNRPDRTIRQADSYTTITGSTSANAATAIVGVGTTFTTQLEVGQRVSFSSNLAAFAFVDTITDNTHMTLTNALGDGTSQTIIRTDINQEGYTGEFQTPHSVLVPSTDPNFNARAMTDKLFDFVEIEFIPTGLVTLFCDVYIDGRKTQTVSFLLNKSNQLNEFVLNSSRLQGRSTRRQKMAIQGRGRTVSFRFYNAGVNENFKICSIFAYARIGGVDEKGSLDAGTRNNA